MMKKSWFFPCLALSCICSAAEIAAPWNGGIEVRGNGKFNFQKAALPLRAGQSYRCDFQICKTPPLSAKNIEHRLVLFVVSGDKFVEIADFATEVPPDGKSHHVSSAFTVPSASAGEFLLFAYNCNATGTMKITDFTITELPDAPSVKIGVAAPAQPAVQPTAAVGDSNLIVPRLGNTESGFLEGNGRFLFKNEVIPLKRNGAYTVTFEMCKKAPLSPNSAEHRMVILLKSPTGQVRELCYAGEKVPVDGNWHEVKADCVLPDAPGDFMVFLYNCNAEGSVEVKNLKFTLRGPMMPWGTEPVFSLAGNGKSQGKYFNLTMTPGKVYTVGFKMRKTPKLSSNSAEHRVVLSCVTASGRVYEFYYLGEAVPVDGNWHEVKADTLVPADCGGVVRLNIYNCNADGKLELSDFSAVEK